MDHGIEIDSKVVSILSGSSHTKTEDIGQRAAGTLATVPSGRELHTMKLMV